uniref:Uncharacterized protein n=3 Tax=Vibrionaceae TaxID=641 RepID=A0A0H3ZKW8_9VIBR|nr:hypothetical protein [Enterovibrio norvegicus]AKN36640.1 hypothetical protein [Vibrio tasmaniensis]AKN36837.1 hypothetical protein [Vibrio sp. 1F_148]AKN38015.1 hypothetical protein [Vibrio tasmaniensis]
MRTYSAIRATSAIPHHGMPLLLPKFIAPAVKPLLFVVLDVLPDFAGPEDPPVKPPPPVKDVNEPSISETLPICRQGITGQSPR